MCQIPCYLPVIIVGNMQSLANKFDQMSARVKDQQEYCMCSMICYTEAWRCCLGPAHKEINIDDFCLFRSDGTKDSGKMNGSGRLGKTHGTYAKHRDVDCRCKTILHTRSKQVTWYFTPSQPVGLYQGDHTRKNFTHSCHCMCHQTQM